MHYFLIFFRSEKVPNIHPISPLIDLQAEEHVYNSESLITAYPNLYANTIFSSREQSQKYPWTRYR